MARIKAGFSRYTDGDLVAKAEHVIDQLTANVGLFPTPNPTTAELTTAKEAFAAVWLQPCSG